MKLPEEMSEAYFRAKVIDPWLARWAHYSFPTTGVRCRNGIPDYLVHVGRMVCYIEAKSLSGALSGYQVNEIAKIRRGGILVYVVDPKSWGQISQSILQVAFPENEREPLNTNRMVANTQYHMSRDEGTA